jgi:predicted phosphodiesterase
MQIAVLADIHGNLPALQAVTAEIHRLKPDLVFVAGDFQNRGPNPREVTEFVAQSGWTLLRGNHEDYVIRQSVKSNQHLADQYNWLPARWTADLTGDFVDSIKRLPISTTFIGPNNLSITIAHGSTRSNNEGFFPTTTEAKAIEMIGNDPPGLLCVGHSHLPFIRKVNATLLVNVGAVGFPFDGDQRASFGLLTWDRDRWEVEICRIEYAVEKVVQEFERVNFYQGAGPLSHLIRRELESARPHLTPFEYLFGAPLREGNLTIQKAVGAYMEMSQIEIEEQFSRVFKEVSVSQEASVSVKTSDEQ